MIKVTSVGIYGGLQVTSVGSATVTTDSPVSSSYTPRIGRVQSVGLYSGLEVTSVGSFTTYLPQLYNVFVGPLRVQTMYYVDTFGNVAQIKEMYSGSTLVYKTP